MDREKKNLDQDVTNWPLVRAAHQGVDQTARGAMLELLQQYRESIQKYLLGATRNSEAAEEIFQDFTLRFVRGDFHQADPSRGRFRDLIKTALSNLVRDYRKREQVRNRGRVALSDAMAPAESDLDRTFHRDWLKALLARVRVRLSAMQNPEGAPYFELFLLMFENPDWSSAQFAERLTAQANPAKPFNPGQVRKLQQRTRERVSDLLIDEVCRSLRIRSVEQAEQELHELGLLDYCGPALRRRTVL